jgi:uncharacterized membrane protein SpoIIM required for sporulation
MDIDRFIVTNQPTWDRLAELTARARRRVGALDDAELEELIQLYQRVSTQLSHARTYVGDTALTARLTRLVADANAVIYGRRARTTRSIGLFFAYTFPGAVWGIRRAVVASTLLLFVPVVVMIVWLTNSPEALDALASPAEREVIVDEEFAAYYSEQPSAQFATLVGVNNIRVSFMAFALGALFVAPGAYILVSNGVHVGEVGAILTAAGEADLFWTLIIPHGLLELTAIVLAAAAGIHLGWTLIAPGDRTRVDALADEGRRAAAVVLGLVAFFVVAALIEGFVTGSALPIGVKVAVGAGVWLATVLYLVVQGRAAMARGLTGRLGEHDRPAPAPVEQDGQSRPVAFTWR